MKVVTAFLLAATSISSFWSPVPGVQAEFQTVPEGDACPSSYERVTDKTLCEQFYTELMPRPLVKESSSINGCFETLIRAGTGSPDVNTSNEPNFVEFRVSFNTNPGGCENYDFDDGDCDTPSEHLYYYVCKDTDGTLKRGPAFGDGILSGSQPSITDPCGTGSMRVMDINECNRYLEGLTLPAVGSSQIYFPGCHHNKDYTNSGSSLSDVWFNESPNGQIGSPGSDILWVCYRPTSSGGGDPHFKLWNGRDIDYQGLCDIILSQSSYGADGLPFNFFARLTSATSNKRHAHKDNYTFISEVVLQIGDNVFEVQAENVIILHNQKYFASVADNFKNFEKAVEEKNLQFKLTKEVKGQRKNMIVFKFTFKNLSSIIIVANKHFKTLSVEMDGDFNGAADIRGLLGSPKMSGLLDREGNVMNDDDMDSYGSQWQIRDEPKLFKDQSRSPQYPEKCEIVNQHTALNLRGGAGRDTSSSSSHRRLLGVGVEDDKDCIKFEALAAESCSQYRGIKKEWCLRDVLKTGDLELAEDLFYS